MYRLNESLQTQLLGMPESGMGFQLVEMVTDTREYVRAIAYNAELVIPDGREHFALFQELRAGKLSAGGPGREVREIVCVLPRNLSMGWAGLSVRENRAAYGKRPYTGPAKDAPPELTKTGQFFRRFSAFANDRRITSDGRLTPGSYATTEEDSRLVRTGKEAVVRYALPNPDPAVHRFTIHPGTNRAIQYGVVEPANGQPGGGEEVIFVDGTNSGSVVHRDQIPPG